MPPDPQKRATSNPIKSVIHRALRPNRFKDDRHLPAPARTGEIFFLQLRCDLSLSVHRPAIHRVSDA